MFANDEDLRRFKEIARRKRLPPSILARMVLGEYVDNRRHHSSARPVGVGAVVAAPAHA